MSAAISGIVSDDCRITVEIVKSKTTRRINMTDIVKHIKRNDQKPEAQALKKSVAEKDALCFLTLLNKPPVRKALIMKPMIRTQKMPAEIDEMMDEKVEPRSVKISGSMPLDRFSVIMLLPKAELTDPLNGIETAETSTK
jgi:hypothetical protein